MRFSININLMSIQRIANSIITRLLLIGVAVVLMGAVGRYFTLTTFLAEDLSRVFASQQESLASYVARDVDYKIVERQVLLRKMAESLPLELLSRPDALRQWLGERYPLQPLFSHGVFVTDQTGQPLADFPPSPLRATVNYGDRDYIRTALAGDFAVGRPVVGRVAQVPVLPMAVPIKDASGQVRAVLAGVTALNAPGFLSLAQQSRIGEGGGFLLVSPRDRLFIASSKPEMALKPTPPEGVNPLHDRAMAGYRGSGVTVNAQGVEEISAMASVPSTGWFVVARIPTAEAFASVFRAKYLVTLGSAGAVIVFIILSSISLLFIFRPLLRAADQADRMTRGDLPLEPLTVVREDEVGSLTMAFNRLLAKLQVNQMALEQAAHHDPLTGLPNRTLLNDRLTQALARAQRNGTHMGVLYLDLDGFKPINDSLGHEAGDAALVEVARRLGAVVRESDTLARLGGDEFMMVMEDLDTAPERAEAAACAVATKCLKALEAPVTLQHGACRIGLSIGIAVGDGHSAQDDLRTAADDAMYKAKQSGGHRYQLATPPGTDRAAA